VFLKLLTDYGASCLCFLQLRNTPIYMLSFFMSMQMLSVFRTSEEMMKIYDKELYFLEQCLRVNPKCYSTWHQRCWIMDKVEVPDWKRELALCNKFLEYDERNCKKLRFVFLQYFISAFHTLMSAFLYL